MRRSIFLFACLLSPLTVAADARFDGAWVAWICPSGVQNDFGKCGNFVLELVQKEGRLCGSHLFATAGAAQLDEGDAASVLGEAANGIASVTLASGRAAPAPRIGGELTLANNRLQWRRLGAPAGSGDLLPASAQFTKSKSKTLRTAAFERELQNACARALAPPPPAAKEAAPEPALQPIPAERIEQSKRD